MKTAAESLCEFADELEFKDIPARVVEKAKSHILDTIGVSALGSVNENTRKLFDVMRNDRGSRQSTILWFGSKGPATTTALANGTMAHALDYDDTHLEAAAHLSAPLVPAALAVAEMTGADGRALLTALVSGYEVMARMGSAAPGQFHKKGFHPTSIFGTLGAAVVAGKLLRLNSEKLADAMGISGSFSSGIFEYLSDGSWVKPIHAGWAAHAGIMAALMAKEGLRGPHSVLEGGFGVYSTPCRRG